MYSDYSWYTCKHSPWDLLPGHEKKREEKITNALLFPNQNPRKKRDNIEVAKRTSCTAQPRYQDKFLYPAILLRKIVSRGHWKAAGEPHAWFSGSSIVFSASIMTSILDARHRGLGNSGLSSEFVSVRLCSEESPIEPLDERELMLNAPDTRRDIYVGKDITVVVLQ